MSELDQTEQIARRAVHSNDLIERVEDLEAAAGPGTTFRNGSGVPSNGLGANGDYYIDADNGNYYKKTAGSYSLIGNLKGPKGDDGDPGPQGEIGPAGNGSILSTVIIDLNEGTAANQLTFTVPVGYIGIIEQIYLRSPSGYCENSIVVPSLGEGGVIMADIPFDPPVVYHVFTTDRRFRLLAGESISVSVTTPEGVARTCSADTVGYLIPA